MARGGSGSEAPVTSYRPIGRSFAPARMALAGLAVLMATGGAGTPPSPDALPAPPVAAAPAAAPAAPVTAATATVSSLASFELIGAVIGVMTYNTAYTAVTTGAASAATGAIGLVAAAGAAAGLIWSGYGPGDENTHYWNLVPAGLGALGGLAAGEMVAYGLLGYSPFGAGIAGYVPLTSLTFSRYANGAYAYMTAILGAKAGLGLYGIERPDDPHPGASPPVAEAPATAPPPPPVAPVPARPGEHGV